METSLEIDPSVSGAILKPIKDAVRGLRPSTNRLCGFARGVEIGISTLQESQSATASIDALQRRSLTLSGSCDDYRLGVALGIDLSINVASTTFTGERATL
jgi:hypothetical protein